MWRVPAASCTIATSRSTPACTTPPPELTTPSCFVSTDKWKAPAAIRRPLPAARCERRAGVLAHAEPSQPSQPHASTAPPPSGQRAALWCLPAASCVAKGTASTRRGASSFERPPWPSAPMRPEPQLKTAPASAVSASVCSSPQHSCEIRRPFSGPATMRGDEGGASPSSAVPSPSTPCRPRPQEKLVAVEEGVPIVCLRVRDCLWRLLFGRTTGRHGGRQTVDARRNRKQSRTRGW